MNLKINQLFDWTMQLLIFIELPLSAHFNLGEKTFSLKHV
jgi:hypothetical protein